MKRRWILPTRVLPYIHSTFRDVATGQQVLPSGLQWSLPGVSQVRFVLAPGDGNTDIQNDSMDTTGTAFRFGLVQAYNRWCVAKDLHHDFKTSASDIESVVWDGPRHLKVQWKNNTQAEWEQVVRYQDIGNLLRQSVTKKQQQQQQQQQQQTKGASIEPLQIWIQGQYYGPLHEDSSSSIDDVLASIPYTENRLEFHQSSCHIRIERYYRGKLRPSQAWDHIWDTLVALEDPEVLHDSNAIIGTATLKDWVVGGTLTSRLWIQEEEDRILFLRPLYNDDPETSDRRYELSIQDGNGNNAMVAERMAMVRRELERLRYLATLQHPYRMETSPLQPHGASSSHEMKMAEIREKLGHGRRKRRFFGL